ncbi:FAD-dependent oxidoreductase [Nocardioides cheoyonin]|uniref:FAD-dependent oxidoreductase n=1 Tax=Nocardioides cheoyonin TaxID=3156615 RepID=UPI0032B3CA6D
MTGRIVVVGGGMAANRLVEGLVAAGLGGSVTVLGEERHAPYNRILLSAVLEGTHRPGALTLRTREWYAEHGVDLRLGTRVVDVHRDRRTVELADRSEVAYDDLVLATGSIPTLPPVRGLVRVDGTLDPRVHAFRSLDDCARLLDAVSAGSTDATGSTTERRAVVVGGGLLGLQVARALAIRGLATEIVEGAEHVMPAQLAAGAGQVLARSLRKLGTQVYTGARAVRLTGDGLRLDNGYTLDTDLVVLAAGGRPSANLARRAGLTVRRGLVVDDRLASVDDPHVYAVGDCAQHDDRVTGFVAPAWEQAEVLAARLAGEDATYRGTRLVARLRATDLDVAVLGDPHRAEGESVEVTNPVRGSHRRLVVRDGVIVAGSLVGDLSRIGVITQAFDRGTVLGPREPGQLLMPPAGAPTPVVGDDTEVCHCAGVTAGRVRACTSLADAVESTRATTGCGGCAATVRQLLTTRSTPLEGTRQ